MKIKLSLVVLLALVGSFAFAGCNKEETSSTPSTPDTNAAPAMTNAPSTNAP